LQDWGYSLPLVIKFVIELDIIGVLIEVQPVGEAGRAVILKELDRPLSNYNKPSPERSFRRG
jgi:hypothetical protein